MRNLWHNPQSAYSPRQYFYDGKPLFAHRGVHVFKSASGWDYVLADATVMQRGGFSKDAAPQIINELLDGKAPCALAIATHLRAHGHRPMTYDEYSAKPSTWRAAR